MRDPSYFPDEADEPLQSLASEFADELAACGHDAVTTLDVLDVLASTGLTLIREYGAASIAFQDAIRHGVDQ